MKKNLLLFLFLIFLSSSLFVQENLKGKITYSLNTSSLIGNNNPLIGANVYLTGMALGGTVNIEGTYTTIVIPTDTYKAKFSCVCYKSKEFIRIITDNQNFEQEVIQDQKVVVSSKALGQAAAINQQLCSRMGANKIVLRC